MDNVLKEGRLIKRAIGRTRKSANWKKRWFRLTSDELLYFQSETSKVPSGTIVLDSVTAIEVVDISAFNNRAHMFQINFIDAGVHRVLYTQAESRRETDEWVSALRRLFPRQSPSSAKMIRRFHSGAQISLGVWSCCRQTQPQGCCSAWWIDEENSSLYGGDDVAPIVDIPEYEIPVPIAREESDADADEAQLQNANYDNAAEFQAAFESQRDDGEYEEPFDDHELQFADKRRLTLDLQRTNESQSGKANASDSVIKMFEPEESGPAVSPYMNVESSARKVDDETYDYVEPGPQVQTTVKSPVPKPRPKSTISNHDEDVNKTQSDPTSQMQPPPVADDTSSADGKARIPEFQPDSTAAIINEDGYANAATILSHVEVPVSKSSIQGYENVEEIKKTARPEYENWKPSDILDKKTSDGGEDDDSDDYEHIEHTSKSQVTSAAHDDDDDRGYEELQ